jgi:hypothetical protein
MRCFGIFAGCAFVMMGAASPRADTSPTLAVNAFKNADKDKDGSLDEEELPKAMVPVRAAMKATAMDAPGQGTADKLMKLIDTKKLLKKGTVDEQGFKDFVSGAFEDASSIVQDAERNAEEERRQKLAKEREEQQRRAMQAKKNQNKKKNNNRNKKE